MSNVSSMATLANSLKLRRTYDSLSLMLKIRLQRVGRKHEPAYRLVLTESLNSSKSGRFKEILGSYDPRKTTESLKTDRIQHWLSKGVSPTPSVYNLLINKGIISGKKIHVAKSGKMGVVKT